MSEAFFPVNDLLRRKLQTALVIASLTLSVASTLFLLLSADRVGFSLLPAAGTTLTRSFSNIVWQFILFVGVLIFAVGAVIVSFMVSAMMHQRTRDLGLIKAAGCPTQLVFGYYFTELMIVTFVGCVLGTVLGVVAEFGSTTVFHLFGLALSDKPINLWILVVVFIVFFGLALIFGAQPILGATRMEPVKAMSPADYAGISREEAFKPVSKSGFSLRIALRELIRRKSASQRIILCLSIIFILITVTIAGGLIANSTTTAWIGQASGNGTLLVAHKDVISQYESLLLKFSGTDQSPQFNYTDLEYGIPTQIMSQLSSLSVVSGIDPRLVLWRHVREIPGIVLGGSSAETTTVGDHHEGNSLVIGIEPERVLSTWHIQGVFLESNNDSGAVIGDSVARSMFAEPLAQSIGVDDKAFAVRGVCLDPINNGYVTYVSLHFLEGLEATAEPNIVLLSVESSVSRDEAIGSVRTLVQSVNSDFDVVDLNPIISKNSGYMSFIWTTIELLPIFSLIAASLCLIGFVLIIIDEQRQEFGIFRAVGLTPNAVVRIISWENLLTVLGSYGAGVSIGIILTLTFLIPEPIVTTGTILDTAVSLLLAFAVTFVSGFIPAFRFSRKPIVEMISHF